MNPREKAVEIVGKYYEEIKYAIDQRENIISNNAKACAILHCQGIIEVLGDVGVYSFADPKVSEYWEQVLNEIKQP